MQRRKGAERIATQALRVAKSRAFRRSPRWAGAERTPPEERRPPLTDRQHVGRNAEGPAAPAVVGIIRVGLVRCGRAKPSSALGGPSGRANTRSANAPAAAQPPSRCPLLPGRRVTPSERLNVTHHVTRCATSQTGAQTQGRQTNAISLAQCLPLAASSSRSAYVRPAAGLRLPSITGASRKELCFFGRRRLA